MNPISTYSECSFNRACHYELYPDKLHVTGKVFLRNEFDVTFELKNLNPIHQKIKVRNNNFLAGLGMSSVSAILLLILVSVFHVKFDSLVFVIISCAIVAGLLFCASTIKKVEYYRFTNLSDINVLDIARTGKDRQKFDEFITQLVDAIRKSKVMA